MFREGDADIFGSKLMIDDDVAVLEDSSNDEDFRPLRLPFEPDATNRYRGLWYPGHCSPRF